MAWHYARFIQAVTARGKAAYDIPMYVNTWLAGDDATPGDIPAAGPSRGSSTSGRPPDRRSISIRPTSMLENFDEWCKRYHRDGNPLFMPETRGGAAGAANVFYALGEEAGFGFSPFAIDERDRPERRPGRELRPDRRLAPLLLAAPERRRHPRLRARQGSHLRRFHHERLHGACHPRRDLRQPCREAAIGLIMATGPDEFLGAGKGFRVTFTPRSGSRRSASPPSMKEHSTTASGFPAAA